MNGRMKRLVSELMSFLLVFSLIPTPALAEIVSEATGQDGSAGIVVSDDMTVTDNGDGTYTISSAEEQPDETEAVESESPAVTEETTEPEVVVEESTEPAATVDQTPAPVAATPDEEEEVAEEVEAPQLEAASTERTESSVAQVGENYYDSLQEAINEAQADDTITLLADVDLCGATYTSNRIPISKSLTIDGDGHTITVANRGFGVGEGASSNIDVTFKNVTINNSSDGARCIDTRGNLNSLTLDHVTLDTNGAKSGYTQPLTIGGNQSNAATITIKDSTIQTNDEGTAYYAIITFNPVNMTIANSTIKGWACIYAKGPDGSAGSAGSTFTITDSTLVSKNVYNGTSNAFAMFMAYDDDVTFNVTDSNINVTSASDQYQAIASTQNQDVVVNLGAGNTVTLDGDNAAIAINKAQPVITGGKFNAKVPEKFIAYGYCAVASGNANYPYTIGESIASITTVDDEGQPVTYYYGSLAEAVADAQNGETVTLIKDASGAGIFLASADAKNITIDLNGKTYTVSGPAVGSTGTQNQGMHLEAGNTVTVTNGTLTSTADSGVVMLVQNYCDLTLTNVKLDGSNLPGSAPYTLSNNAGAVTIGAGTTITAKDGGYAFDVCSTNYYPQGTQVTVVDGATIYGNVELGVWGTAPATNKATLTVSGGDLNGQIVNHSNGAIAQKDVMLNGGTYTVDPSTTVEATYPLAMFPVKVGDVYKIQASLASPDIEVIFAPATAPNATGREYVYTGEAITPVTGVTIVQGANQPVAAKQITEISNNKQLDTDDYTVTYTPNINKGTVTATITGADDSLFAGTSTTREFEITAAEITAVTAANVNYTKNEVEPALTVTPEGATYDVAYAIVEGDATASLGANGKPVNAGQYTVTITGNGNYTGTATATFEVIANDLSLAKIVGKVKTYTGSAIQDDDVITVTLGGKELVAGTDYVMRFLNNTNAGTATVTIVGGIGAYTGYQDGEFTIAKAEITTVKGANGEAIPAQAYTGSAIEPEVVVYGKDGAVIDPSEYDVTYTNNIEAGEATVTVAPTDGNKNVTGSATTKFTITAAVARVGNTYYQTLKAAIDAANAGDTVTLLANVEESVAINNAITLDLGGKTVTGRVTANNGEVTVKNGTVAGRLDAYDSSAVTVAADATVSGQVVVWGDGTFGQDGCKTPTLNVYGTVSNAGDSAITTNGSDMSGASINVFEGAVVSSDDIAIYQPSGNVTISGGTVTGATAVYQKSGKLTVSGGTITGTGADAEFAHDGNGAYATGDAIVVETTDYPNGAPVTSVSGGTIVSENASAIGSYATEGNVAETGFITPDSEAAFSDDSDSTKVAVPAGKVLVQSTEDNLWRLADMLTVTFDANGGTPAPEAQSVVPGAKATEPTAPTKDGVFFAGWTLNGEPFSFDTAITESITLTATWTDAVAKIGDTYYTSLIAAIEGAQSGDTIQMLANDTQADYAEIPAGMTLTIDLNGKTVTSTSGGLDVYGTVTITDTSADKAGKVVAARQGVYVDAGGSVTFEAGTIEAANFGFVVEEGATLTMNGGAVENSGSGIANQGTTTVNGGSITTTGFGVDNGGTLTVTGGSITSTEDSNAVFAHGASTTNIQGGTITGTDDAAISTNGSGRESENCSFDAVINITGGEVTSVNEIAVYLPAGTLNVSDGTITGTTAVYAKAGTLNISGGKLVANGGKFKYNYYGNGANSTGDALVVDNCGYPQGVLNITITGGIFDSANGDAIGTYASQGLEELTGFVAPNATAGFSDNSEATLSAIPEGKTLTQANDGYWYLNSVWTVTFAAEGGTPAPEAQKVLNGETATEPAAPTKDGAIFAGWTLEGEFYSFDTPVTADITLVAEWTEAVAEVEGTLYATLQAAIDAAQAGQTVVLLADVSENVTVTADKDVTLDLNGNTVNGKAAGIHTFVVQGELTVVDNAGGGTIKSTTNCGICVVGGELTLESGAVTAQEMAILALDAATVTVNGGTLTAIDNAVIGTNGTAGRGGNTVTVNRGELNGGIQTAGYVACGIYVANSDTVTVTGGAINVTGGAGIVARAGSVSVTGGTITTTGSATGRVGDSRVVVPCSAIVFDSEAAYPGMDASSAIAISGGTFVSEADSVATVGDAHRVDINGGAFSDDSGNAVDVPEGKYLKLDSDGLYRLADFTVVQVPTAETGLVYDGTEQTGVAAGEGYTLTGNTGTNAGDYTATATLAEHCVWSDGTYEPKTIEWSIAKADIANAVVTPGAERVTYTGEAITNAPTVKLDGATLTADTDYTVTYADNTDAGVATITVAGTGNYTGTATAQFTIVPNTDNITVTGAVDMPYTGSAAEQANLVVKQGETVIPAGGYTVTYTNNVEPGTATYVVTLTGNRTGTFIGTFQITPAVARIGDTYFQTLQEALDAAQAGDTVVLLADVTENVTVASGKDVTLDLNSNTVANADANHTVYVYGKLAVVDNAGGGTIKSTNNCGICVQGGTLNFTSGTVEAQEMAVLLVNAGTATIDGGTFVAKDNAVLGTNGTAGQGGNTLAVNGGTFEGAIQTAGYVACGIYVANSDTVTVNGGDFTITGGAGIVARAGSVTVNGGTITTTGSATGKVGDSRVVVPCSAIVFDSEAAYPGMTSGSAIAISGGTFVSEAASVSFVGDAHRVDITGGAFSDDSGNAVDVPVGKYLAQDTDGLYRLTDYTVVAKPVAQSFTYDGTEQTGVEAGEGYTLTGTTKATKAGDYTATAALADRCVWSDGTYDPIELSWSIAKADLASAIVTTVASVAYTGEAQTPDVTVELNGATVDASEYDVTYADNVEAGTATATVTAKADGNYKGTASATFVITKGDLAEATVTVSPDSYTYSGSANEPTVTVTLNGETIDPSEYTVDYANNTNAGTATVTVTATPTAKVQGVNGTTFQIAKANIADATIVATDKAYTGTAQTIDSVTFNGTELVEGTDYKVIYAGNVEAGTATAVIIGQGNFEGDVTKTFTIIAVDKTALAKAVSDAETDQSDTVATEDTSNLKPGTKYVAPEDAAALAAAIEAAQAVLDDPTATQAEVDAATAAMNDAIDAFEAAKKTAVGDLTKAEIAPIADQTYDGTAKTPALTVTMPDGTVLTAGTDYEATYTNNVEAGEARVSITGIGNYAGTLEAVFTIQKADISEATVTASDQVYDGTEKKSEPIVTLNGAVLSADNYDVTYSADVTNVGEVTVTVTGKNNLTGTATGTYKITPADISNAVFGAVSDQVFTGKAITPTAELTFNGKALTEGVDYILAYADNVAVGEAQIVAIGQGNFTGFNSKVFNITPKSLEGATVTAPDQVFDGTAKTPATTVTLDGVTLTEGTDYEAAFANNTAIGTATVTITGKGNYTGTASGTFQIKPASIADAIITPDPIPNQTVENGPAKPALTLTMPDGTVLTEGEDFTVEYASNDKPGTATATIKGIGDYAGEVVKPFTIDAVSIDEATIEPIDDQTWTGEEIEPENIVVKLGDKVLTEGTDYELSFKNNVDEGTATVTATGKGAYDGSVSTTFKINMPVVPMYRLYNPWSGEHFYTADKAEVRDVVAAGWNYEGIAWWAPLHSNTPVYRLYNPWAGDHHYTTDSIERTNLLNAGWLDEGIGWYSDDAQSVTLLREYNPYATTGTHNYTADTEEHTYLVSLGWKDEGIGWYGVEPTEYGINPTDSQYDPFAG